MSSDPSDTSVWPKNRWKIQSLENIYNREMRSLLFYTSLLLIGWFEVTIAVDPLVRLDEMLNNQTIVETYSKCFLDRGPCAQDARTLKRILPEFVASRCGKCTEKQKIGACRILFTMQQEKYQSYWADLLEKYDPRRIHRMRLDDFMRNCALEYHVID